MRWGILLAVVVGLLGCDKPPEDALVIGTIAGPETALVEVAKIEAFKQHGLRIKIVEFSDYNLPNEALDDRSLDANIYQHRPYLEQSMRAKGYPFEIMGKSFIYPMGLYSSKYHNLKELPEGAMIAVPNDPSNEERALRLLALHHLIKLKPGEAASIEQIEENPKHFVFKALDAAQLPRILPDVGAAVINTTFAITAGLRPSKDALILEDKNSPYVNIIVVRKDNPKKEQLKLFVASFQSPAVKQKAQELFGDGAIAAW
ncbi:MAG: MetQ/NlpA family ABC transporter substrate-binding protein [Gammaproteobacteria bacterium]|nr:MetQ/NlpA family ABC transporter substrate-binding protein [Gammaproteobacteria bacterium]